MLVSLSRCGLAEPFNAASSVPTRSAFGYLFIGIYAVFEKLRGRPSLFDSYDTALVAHESEAYKKALQALGSNAERDFRIVEGA